MASGYLEKAAIGFYKPKYMVLTNHELYLYEAEGCQRHQDMLVLTPGVFVEQPDPVYVDSTQIKGVVGARNQQEKLYPLQVVTGGHPGSIGIEQPELALT